MSHVREPTTSASGKFCSPSLLPKLTQLHANTALYIQSYTTERYMNIHLTWHEFRSCAYLVQAQGFNWIFRRVTKKIVNHLYPD